MVLSPGGWITLVRFRCHIIGATKSHDLPEAILADQGAPADHSEISARRTNVIKSVRLNSVGGADPPIRYVLYLLHIITLLVLV